MQTNLHTPRRSQTAVFSSLLLVVLFSALLSGCGWRLQGSYRIPPDLYTVYLQSFDRYSELTRAVRDRLRLQAVTVISQPNENVATVYIKDDYLFRRTLSLFENGQTAEYELNYRVNLELQRPGVEPYRFQLSAQRDYQDNPDQALAKTREVELLLSEMRQEIADLVVRELARTDTRESEPEPEIFPEIEIDS